MLDVTADDVRDSCAHTDDMAIVEAALPATVRASLASLTDRREVLAAIAILARSFYGDTSDAERDFAGEVHWSAVRMLQKVRRRGAARRGLPSGPWGAGLTAPRVVGPVLGSYCGRCHNLGPVGRDCPCPA